MHITHNKYLLLFPFKTSALLPKLAYLLASLSCSIVFKGFACVNDLLQLKCATYVLVFAVLLHELENCVLEGNDNILFIVVN